SNRVSDLHDKLDKVRDRESFLDFVQALIEDRIEKAKDENRYPYGGQPGGWESSTIECGLEVALCGGRGTHGTCPSASPARHRGAASRFFSTAAKSTSNQVGVAPDLRHIEWATVGALNSSYVVATALRAAAKRRDDRDVVGVDWPRDARPSFRAPARRR